MPFRQFSRSLTFFPDRPATTELARRAAEGGLEPWFNQADERIGWKTQQGSPDSPLLILHGNAGSAVDRAELARFLQLLAPEDPRRIFILEYPGYGDRAGQPSEDSMVAAATAALKEFSTAPIVLGESIGSGVAALAAAVEPTRIRSLVLVTPFTSLVEVARYHYPWLPVGWLLADRFESAMALPKFPGPVAFILAGEDQITPTESGRQLYLQYPGPKVLHEVPGAGHNEAVYSLGSAGWQDILRRIEVNTASP